MEQVRHYYDEYGNYRGHSITEAERRAQNEFATYGLTETPEPPLPVGAATAINVARLCAMAAVLSFLLMLCGEAGILTAPLILAAAMWSKFKLKRLGVSKGQTSAAWAIGLAGFWTFALLIFLGSLVTEKIRLLLL